MASLNWSQDSTDFEVVVEQPGLERVTFKTHKKVLADKSGFFRDLFNSNFKETQENRITIKEFRPETVRELIEWHYGTKKGWKGLEESRELLKAAHLYQTKGLLESFEEHFAEDLSDDNVIKLWLTSRELNLKGLLAQTGRYIVANPNKRKAEDWPDIDEVFKQPSMGKAMFILMSTKADKVYNIHEKPEKDEAERIIELCYYDGECQEIMREVKYQVKVRSTDTILDVKEKLIVLRAKQEDEDKKGQEFPFEKPDDFDICWQVEREENKDVELWESGYCDEETLADLMIQYQKRRSVHYDARGYKSTFSTSETRTSIVCDSEYPPASGEW